MDTPSAVATLRARFARLQRLAPPPTVLGHEQARISLTLLAPQDGQRLEPQIIAAAFHLAARGMALGDAYRILEPLHAAHVAAQTGHPGHTLHTAAPQRAAGLQEALLTGIEDRQRLQEDLAAAGFHITYLR